MTDRELEERLRAWYAAEVGESERAPAEMRERIMAIPASTPMPLRPIARRRNFTLLAVAAVLVVGGGLAAGAGLMRFTSVVTPSPSDLAVVPSTSPPPPATPSPTTHLRAGGLIAFTRLVEKPERKCTSFRRITNCPTLRLWMIEAAGGGAHELQTGSGRQTLVGWSSDGARLVYQDEDKLYVTDTDGSPGQPADTGCVAPCQNDSQISMSDDGRRIVFVRSSSDGSDYAEAIVTMDLTSGVVAELSSTSPRGGGAPTLSPDGGKIAFYSYGSKPDGGPFPETLSAIWVVDSDGQNLRQVSPTTLAAQNPRWSPDGARIVFISPRQTSDGSITDVGFVYTMRPDGSDVRRLTDDGAATGASWTPDGRILFIETGNAPGLWTMDPDGTNAARSLSTEALGVAVGDLGSLHPAWQPVGGSALAPLPWTPDTAVAVGPPAPTPIPTPTPALARGFSWTGSPVSGDDSPLGETAALLADGRVLFAGGCNTAAQVYDPVAGSFSSTGSLAQVRASATATRLHDGRVLFAGGYNCAAAGQDGMWASAELYDPTTGTFSPTGSMAAPRSQHTATLLADGRVLIAGGLSGPTAATGEIRLAGYRTAAVDAFLATAEIYDPATGTFSKTDSMSTPHRGHTATLLQDGRVLVVGNGGETSTAGKVADVYDPATGTFSPSGSMRLGRWLHTATLLADGRVLILGGRTPQDSVRVSAELYDPRSGTFSAAGSMQEGRQQQTATLLQDGRVLIAGGYWSDGSNWRVLSSSELYDPAARSFAAIGSMGTPREGATATLLNDGRVLIVGGIDIGSSGGVTVTSAVLYQP